MIIKNAKFITSVADYKKVGGQNSPEIAVAGKSNVGKSTFINFLTNNGGLAKTSSTPGKTRLVNYFSINNGEFMLVDLPGYGFAKVSDDEKKKWDKMMSDYLLMSKDLKCVAVLVDIRHEPTSLDKQMIAFLHHYHIPFFVIATKSDKLSRMQIQKQKQIIATALSLGKEDIVAVSSMKKEGKEQVLQKIEIFLKNDENEEEIQE